MTRRAVIGAFIGFPLAPAALLATPVAVKVYTTTPRIPFVGPWISPEKVAQSFRDVEAGAYGSSRVAVTLTHYCNFEAMNGASMTRLIESEAFRYETKSMKRGRISD